jgi:peptide chain release factor 2
MNRRNCGSKVSATGFSICGGIFDLEVKEEQVALLEREMEQGDFWNDNLHAKEVIAEVNRLRTWTIPYREVQNRFANLADLLPEAESVGDVAFTEELYAELDVVERKLEELEVRKMLSGKMDSANCYLSINAGAGGTEACDWVHMLSRMYQRWATKRGWQMEILDSVEGEVAGLKSITFKITGPFSYGYTKAEKGVHRLVRISPFDANAKRHTSFASIEVTPELDEAVEVEVRSEDLKVDTYRASGAGGQHVNKTDSAVRITHLPSGIVVSCQKERSQVQNREACLKMLQAKLYEKEMAERKAEIAEMAGEKKEIAWGHQIRSYVFQPYTLVKDARTGYEIGNIQAVMDGGIDPFILAYLKEFG